MGRTSFWLGAAFLAAGISTAMNATLLGLAVAIPCMIAYSYLMNRANRLVGELNRGAIRVIDLLKQRYFEMINSTIYQIISNGVTVQIYTAACIYRRATIPCCRLGCHGSCQTAYKQGKYNKHFFH